MKLTFEKSSPKFAMLRVMMMFLKMFCLLLNTRRFLYVNKCGICTLLYMKIRYFLKISFGEYFEAKYLVLLLLQLCFLCFALLFDRNSFSSFYWNISYFLYLIGAFFLFWGLLIYVLAHGSILLFPC